MSTSTNTVPTAAGPVGGALLIQPGTYALDSDHSSAGFVARHLMVSKVRGSFDQVSGTITVAEDPAASSVTATIAAASINTGSADRDKHLRSPDFLDVERFPNLTFRSTSLVPGAGSTFTLVGDLTIRDVTRQVQLAVEFDGSVTNPWGQEVIGFTATTEIDREEFGMTWNVALETGGVLVGKKITVELSLQAKSVQG